MGFWPVLQLLVQSPEVLIAIILIAMALVDLAVMELFLAIDSAGSLRCDF